MKTVVLLFALSTIPLAAAPPELPELARQLERFPATRGQGTESARLARFFDLYWDASMRISPDYASYIGYTGVEDRLPDLSPEGRELARRVGHLEIAALTSVDRSRLTAAEQLNYDLLRRQFDDGIEGERFPGRYLLVTSMNNRMTSMLGLLDYMPARTVADYEAMLTRLRDFARLNDQGMARLDEGLKLGITPPRVSLLHAADQVAAAFSDDPFKSPVLAPFLTIPDTIPAAERDRLRRTAGEVFAQQVMPALHKLHDYLANTYVPHARETIAMSDLPDGKAWYAYQLRTSTTTNLTPDEIHNLGLAEVKRIRVEIDTLIASTGFKGNFKEFSAYLRTDPRFFYDKPEDLVAGYRDIAKRLDPELIKFFGRLPRLPYGVTPMGEHSETAPSALYGNGSLAAGRAGSMLINTYDLKSRPKWAMESLTAHEAVPGHHLQYSLVEELGELPKWRQWDVYPAFSEGWGLYAESLAAELGLYKDPYSKFGQLNNEIWRAIRLVVDTGLHAKGWTRQQTVDYCRANSAKTDLEIENEVDRYISNPGGAPCYKIGAMKIQELRRYAEKELGANFDIRAFHDRVLGNGQLPLDLLEKSVKEWVAERRKP